MYGDLVLYNLKKKTWLRIQAPGAAPPRCAHQAVLTAGEGGQLWIFGGEYASPSQSQFYHYKDLWVFYLKTKKWEKIKYCHYIFLPTAELERFLKKCLIF